MLVAGPWLRCPARNSRNWLNAFSLQCHVAPPRKRVCYSLHRNPDLLVADLAHLKAAMSGASAALRKLERAALPHHTQLHYADMCTGGSLASIATLAAAADACLHSHVHSVHVYAGCHEPRTIFEGLRTVLTGQASMQLLFHLPPMGSGSKRQH